MVSRIPFDVNRLRITIDVNMLVVSANISVRRIMAPICLGIRFRRVFFIVIFWVMPGWFMIKFGAIFIPVIKVVP
jgi:hypothetical protein